MAMSKMDLGPLKDTVNCSICMETLDDPRSLPCMHIFCRKCIQGIMDRYRRNFPCPICRERCPISNQGAAGLKVNCFVNSVLDAMKGLKVADTTWNCDICYQDGKSIRAVSQCIECNEKLCQLCGHVHKRSRLSKSHLILDLTGDRSLDAKAAISMLSQRTLYCQEHYNEPLKYFCKDDQHLICQDCFAFNHQGHELENIEKTARVSKENLSSVIDLGKQRLYKYMEGIKTGYTEKDSIQKNIDNSMTKLDDEQKELHAEVDAHINAMKAKVNNIGGDAMNNIKAQITELENEKKAIDDTVLQLEILSQHGHTGDIVFMVPEINSKKDAWSTEPHVKINHQDRVRVEPSQIKHQNQITFGSVNAASDQVKMSAFESFLLTPIAAGFAAAAVGSALFGKPKADEED
ncbi:unnamed protein product [Owenia fusiformis]|uniref:Uncharacterized protein n=1 Tax=Owenia fusiformis TaxID=6347 RepID=A0A8J1Y9U4_OWEFU|nr:unnamed protein product [Owenia fusiformis]